MNILVIFSFVFTLVLRINGVEESKWKLSREDVAEIEKQIQLQNTFTVKTIHTQHGDLYDCVNFYKQPAFNHPLTKNLTFTPRKKQTSPLERAKHKALYVKSPKFGLIRRGCPDGTVPIKRVTREDLMRAKLAQVNADKPAGTRICRSYDGASATLAVYNLEVTSEQYSAAIMKLQFGPDSIEAGWRVDPKLYRDNKTHLYIRTDARDIHCFNTLCSGFVVTNPRIPVDSILDKISVRGGEGYEVDLSISRVDYNGQWELRVANNLIGYWPEYLLQQPGAADSVDWGGEVFSPEGTPRPGMGSGADVTEDTDQDAYYSFVKVRFNNDGKFVDPVDLVCKAQSAVYEAKDEGNVGEGLEYLIYYGGPPSVGG